MSRKAAIADPASAPDDVRDSEAVPSPANSALEPPLPREVGGRGGLDPTRYGDWEMRGRCVDF